MKAIFDRQLKNQRMAYGVDFKLMSDQEKIEFVHWNMLALHSELTEMLDEYPWKPWSTDFAGEIIPDAIVGEAADVLCFFVNLLLVAGITADDLEKAYMKKADINAARQLKGYNVGSPDWKCAQCGRALDDPGVKCTKQLCARFR